MRRYVASLSAISISAGVIAAATTVAATRAGASAEPQVVIGTVHRIVADHPMGDGVTAGSERSPSILAAKAAALGPEVLWSQEGRASWYGAEFAGSRTASGERFDASALTAAHRELPFGTIVRVTNLANGAQVDVRITDRGPFAHGRVLDLSEAAATAIGIRSSGVGTVRLEVLG